MIVPSVLANRRALRRWRGSCLFCLFDLILNVPSTIFQLNRDGSSWVEPVLSWDKCVLLKDHNAVTPVRLEPAASRSRVKHSTTEPLRSQGSTLYNPLTPLPTIIRFLFTVVSWLPVPLV